MRKPRFDTWFWMGHQPREFVITWRLPWRRRIYSVCNDQVMIGHPRVALRLRWGTAVDLYAPHRLVEAGPPANFTT